MPDLTTADTSRMAYEKILASLPKIYRKICWILYFRSGGQAMTSLEIDEWCPQWKLESDKRMAEMLRQDLVKECGVRKCNISGREAMTYTITGNPRKTDTRAKGSRPSKRELIKLLHDAEAIIAQEPKTTYEVFRLAAAVQDTLKWVLGMNDRRPLPLKKNFVTY